MQSNGSKVIHKPSAEKVKRYWARNKQKGYKRKLFWVSPATEYKLNEYAKGRNKGATWILDDLMKNVF